MNKKHMIQVEERLYMGFYLGIEDLAANALIALMRQNESNRFVSYKILELYGTQVVKALQENGEKAVLLLSRNRTNAFLHDYSDFFGERTENGAEGIWLKEGKSKSDLIRTFCGYLAADVLLALSCERSVSVLENG